DGAWPWPEQVGGVLELVGISSRSLLFAPILAPSDVIAENAGSLYIRRVEVVVSHPEAPSVGAVDEFSRPHEVAHVLHRDGIVFGARCAGLRDEVPTVGGF